MWSTASEGKRVGNVLRRGDGVTRVRMSRNWQASNWKGGERMNYFEGCHTEAEIKARFRDLCFEHHPDRKGGDTRTMQDVHAQYKERLRGEYRKTKDDDEAEAAVEADEAAAEIVGKLVVLPDLVVELVGRWIWVTGNTYALRAELKAIGLFWAAKKRAWYWHAPEDKCRGGKKTLEEIKAKYGARQFTGKSFARLAA